MYFKYDEEHISHLKKKDKKLAAAIDYIGEIQREVNCDVFSSLIHSIIGQQISTIAQKTIWKRFCDKLGIVDAQNILSLSDEEMQALGISFRKVTYIKNLAQKVLDKEINIQAFESMEDKEIIEILSSLNGIGVWTAEMLLLFSMQRFNILSYGDYAIHKGLRMLYGHKKIDKEKFARFHKRYSPYASVASLYLWAIAGNAIPDLKDPAAIDKAKKRK